MKRGRAEDRCIYCGSTEELTRDHIPPKCFFPRPRPSDLITVTSCRACNQGVEKDEEFFLATFMFSEAGVGQAGKALWKEQMKRSLFRERGVGRAIRSRLKIVSLNSPAGLYLGNRYGLEIDYQRLDTVVRKTVRGLYLHEYGVPLALESVIDCRWLNTKQASDEAHRHVSRLPSGSRRWPGVFEYRCERVEDATDQSLWLLLFFDFAVWWAVTGIGGCQ